MKIPKEIGTLILIALLIFLGYIIPITLVLGNAELRNPDIAFSLNLFSTILIIGLVGATILYFTRYLWRGDNTYGDSFGLNNIGDKPSFSFFKKFNALQLTFASIIFFSVIFFIANLLGTKGLTGSQVLPQQFTPTESLVFSTLLIPISEEMMSLFVTGILVFGLVLLALKYKISYNDFKLYYFLFIPILMGVFAFFWHGSAYPNSDVARWVVFIFWTLKTFIILATGFVAIGIVQHMANNFFVDFTRIFTSDATLWITIGVTVILAGVGLYYSSKKKKEVI